MTNHARRPIPLAAALLLLAAAAAAGPPPVIDNPAAPADGATTLRLVEQWRAGGPDDEIFFGTISEFLHDADGNIYLLDGQLSEIQVFDRDGGRLVRRQHRHAAQVAVDAPGGQLAGTHGEDHRGGTGDDVTAGPDPFFGGFGGFLATPICSGVMIAFKIAPSGRTSTNSGL